MCVGWLAGLQNLTKNITSNPCKGRTWAKVEDASHLFECQRCYWCLLVLITVVSMSVTLFVPQGQKKLGRSVRPASQNPYPIYDQNLWFSIPYLLRKPPNCRMDSNYRINACPLLYNSGKNLQINLRRRIIEDFIEEERDFVTANVSGWFESSLNMLAGKEFDDVG